MLDLIKREPVRFVAVLTAAYNAVMALLVGWPVIYLTDAQTALLWGVVNAVLIAPFLFFVTREKVAPIGPNVDTDYPA